MNQTTRSICSSCSVHLLNECNFPFKFSSFGLNQVQRDNCRIEFQTIFELVRFIVIPSHDLECFPAN